jgi:hypothetical protein
VTGPGSPYLAVLADSPSRLDLFFNLDSGGFQPRISLVAPEAPVGFAADVFTPDASVSYAVASGTQSSLSVFLANGKTYNRTDYKTPESPGEVDTLDLRGTGLSDLVVASSTLGKFRVFLNDGAGGFHEQLDFDAPGGPVSGIATTHLRGISQDEVMMQSTLTGDIVVYPNAAGTLGAPEVLSPGGALISLTSGKFLSPEGDRDLATIDPIRGELVVLLNSR